VTAPELGQPAPTLTLPDADGLVHEVTAHAGRSPLLVMFLCNHCPYVKHVAPRLGRLNHEWERAGLAVAAVNPNVGRHPGDSLERMGPFALANGWEFRYLADADQSAARAFGAARTPEFFLFDGRQRLAYHGQFDESRPGNGVPVTGSDLEAAVRTVLEGRVVAQVQHPGAGCSIKWDD
jgi:peroxiredoxin